MGTLLYGPNLGDAVTRVGVDTVYTRLHPEGAWSLSLDLGDLVSARVLGVLDGELYCFVGAVSGDLSGFWRLRGGVWTQLAAADDIRYDPNSATVYDGKWYFGSPQGDLMFRLDLDESGNFDALVPIATGFDAPPYGPTDDCWAGPVFQGKLFWGTLRSGEGGIPDLWSYDGAAFTHVLSSDLTPGTFENAVVYDGLLWVAFSGSGGTEGTAELWSLDSGLAATKRLTLSTNRLRVYSQRGQLLAQTGSAGLINELLVWDGADLVSFGVPTFGPASPNQQVTSDRGALYYSTNRWREDDPAQPTSSADAPNESGRSLIVLDGDLYLLGVSVYTARVQGGDNAYDPTDSMPDMAIVDDFDRADEAPLSQGGNWAGPPVDFDTYGYQTNPAKLASDNALADLADPEEKGYVLASSYRTDVGASSYDVAVRVTSFGVNAYSPNLTARVVNPGTVDAALYALTTVFNTALELYLETDNNAAFLAGFSVPGDPLAEGDWIRFRVAASRLSVYVQRGGATPVGPWEQCSSTVVDDTISDGSVGIEFGDVPGSPPYGQIDRFAWGPVTPGVIPDPLPPIL